MGCRRRPQDTCASAGGSLTQQQDLRRAWRLQGGQASWKQGAEEQGHRRGGCCQETVLEPAIPSASTFTHQQAPGHGGRRVPDQGCGEGSPAGLGGGGPPRSTPALQQPYK